MRKERSDGRGVEVRRELPGGGRRGGSYLVGAGEEERRVTWWEPVTGSAGSEPADSRLSETNW